MADLTVCMHAIISYVLGHIFELFSFFSCYLQFNLIP